MQGNEHRMNITNIRMKQIIFAITIVFMILTVNSRIVFGGGTIAVGGWEEEYLRHLANAFAVPLNDSLRPFTARLCAEILVEIENKQEFKKKITNPYLKEMYRKMCRRFEYELAIARQPNRNLSVKFVPIDKTTLMVGYRDRQGEYNTAATYTDDPQPLSCFESELQIEHSFYFSNILAIDLAESALGQVNSDPQDDQEKEDGRIYVEKLKMNLIYWNILLGIGRDRMVYGYGKTGDMILSDNAGPYDAINIQAFRPFSFPWYFKYLGSFYPSAFLARIQGNRNDYDHPVLIGTRLTWSPWPYLEMSASRTIFALGEGRESPDAEEWWNIFSGQMEHEGAYGYQADTNQLVELDTRLNLSLLNKWWSIGAFSIHYQMGAESWARTHLRPYVVANLAGIEYDSIKWGLWFEWVDTNQNDNYPWYYHYNYTDGYTQQNQIIGHPIGFYGNGFWLGGWFYLSPKWKTALKMDALMHFQKKNNIYDDRRYAGEGEIDWSINDAWRLIIIAGTKYTRDDLSEEDCNDLYGKIIVEWNR